MKHNYFVVVAICLVIAASSFVDNAQAADITGLKIRIETPHLEESISFYTTLLGLHVLDKWDDADDKGVILGLGDSAGGEAFLEIAYSAVNSDQSGTSLQFRVDDLDAVVDVLQDQWDFSGPTERPWGSTYLYLEDPSGVEVIVYEGEL